MSSTEERLHILEMLENGIISSEEAAHLLQAVEDAAEADAEDGDEFEDAELEDDSAEDDGAYYADDAQNAWEEDEAPEAAPTAAPQPASFASSKPPPDLAKWRNFWFIPLIFGVGVTVISALLLYRGIQASWATFWMACIWMPLLLGIAVTTMAAMSKKARWLHVRVKQPDGEWPQNIAISFPIPLRTSAWVLRLIAPRIDVLDEMGLDEVIIALGESATPETPLYIDVDQGDSGEQVQVYIG